MSLIEDYTVENARGAPEFYLDTNTDWCYQPVTEHLRVTFESRETFS